MKVNKIILVILVLGIIIEGICAVLLNNQKTDTSNLYALTTVVKELDTKNDVVICMDFNGNEWTFKGCEDWYVGDYCSLLMYDNETDIIYDDEIIKETYCGWLEGKFGYKDNSITLYE